MAEIKKIFEDIKNLKVSDVAKLIEIFEEEFGPIAMPAASAQSSASASPEPQGEVQTEFKVSFGKFDASKKIGIIKVVRSLTGLGLKEAKDLVEQEGEKIVVDSPKPKQEAEEIKKALAEAGAEDIKLF